MNKKLKHLNSLSVYTILTTGRTGSDLFQSLLDSHPQVLTFNGHFQMHYFWRTSICVASGDFMLSDFIDEFIGKHIEKFKSKYDLIEGKDRLGPNWNQSINIDLPVFKEHFYELMVDVTVNLKNCFLAIHGAYALALNEDIFNKKILLHHLHRHDELKYFIIDYPDCKIISMTRDPRANYYSGCTHHIKFNPESMAGPHHYFYIKRIVEDVVPIKHLNNEYVAIRLEDLGDIEIIKKISVWLNIDFNETLLVSTWAGLIWNADRLTENKRTGSGYCENIVKNNWNSFLSKSDKYILNFIMSDRLKHYGYSYYERSLFSYFIVIFLIMIPMSFEKPWFRLFTDKKTREIKKVLLNSYFYFKRCVYFYKQYIKIVCGKKFNGKLIKA